MQSELGSLIEDIRENILYLQELGVSAIDADISSLKVPVQEKKITAAPAQTWAAPPENLQEHIAEKKTTPDPAAAPARSRREMLEATKLSRLSDTTSSERPSLDMSRAKTNVRETPAKEGAQEEKDSALADSMFGDITPSIRLAPTVETLEDIHRSIAGCKMCRLWEGRTQIVNSTGNLKAKLMFIGEAPGADEDAQGKPFVGRAGQLLTKIIEAMGISRDDVFIGNINRCRPPQNRQPMIDEATTCKPFLLREIAVVRPEVIVVLGATAMQNLLETKAAIGKLRGTFQDYYGIKVMPTFHPAYLLRDPHKKREVWEDMKKVKAVLDALP